MCYQLYQKSILSDEVMQAMQQETAVCGFSFEQQEVFLEAEQLEIKQCVLRQVALRESRLLRPDWSDVVLEDCDLSGVQLRDGTLHKVTLRRCKLVGTDLSGTFLREVTFEDCICRYANLSAGRWREITMKDCDFSSASMDMVEYKNWKLSNCILQQTNLTQTALAKMDLSTCEIAGLILQGEELRGAAVSQWQAAELLRFLGVEIKSAAVSEQFSGTEQR